MDKSRMQRLAGIEKTNQLNESIGGYVDIQPLKEFDINEENKDSNEDMEENFKSSAQRKAVWASYNDKNEGVDEANSIIFDKGWEDNGEEDGDPIQMAIQNLRSMFPGITDADIAEYLETYQEKQSMEEEDMELEEKKGDDAEKKEKDYKGINMSKKDVMDKMGKGKTNTVKGDRAKAYTPPHAKANESLSESKIKPNREFLW